MALKCADHGSNLSKVYSKLFKEQRNIDVTLSAMGRVFHCHKIVLASQSEFFEKLLYNPALKGSDEIYCIDANPEHMELILQYIYSGQMDFSTLSDRTMVQLINLAVRFGLPLLEDALVEGLNPVYKPAEFITAYNIAQILSLTKLREKYAKYYWESLHKINQKLLLDMDGEAMVDFLSHKVGEVIERFHLIHNWLQMNPACSLKVRNDLLEFIDLTQFYDVQLITEVYPSKMFTAEEVMEALFKNRLNFLVKPDVNLAEFGAEIMLEGKGAHYDVIVDLKGAFLLNSLEIEHVLMGQKVLVQVSLDKIYWRPLLEQELTDSSATTLKLEDNISRFIKISNLLEHGQIGVYYRN